jgi:hypothetical protein
VLCSSPPTLRLEKWSGTQRLSADAILFLLVWGLPPPLGTRPVPPSYWITSPLPPNFEYYPFSDSMTYDLGSQFALIGQGIFNYVHRSGSVHELPGLPARWAARATSGHVHPGRDVRGFSALLYLIGKRLHSRTALTLAVLIIFRGLTSLDASAWIDTATFKHMLTDFPTATGWLDSFCWF